MSWDNLLSSKRRDEEPDEGPDGRSPFHVDLDRIVFSQPFRRLQDKTQVHPRSPNDHVRRRLTHSIEVASIGRTLGAMVAPAIGVVSGSPVSAGDVGLLMQAACHAHDIGNPPFGHLGEEAIRDWFGRQERELRGDGVSMTRRQWAELKTFEGNAQGFRILCRTEEHKGMEGMNLSYATLGAFMKYPNPVNGHPAGKEKFGYFESEQPLMAKIADELRLGEHAYGAGWRRHPLAFLLEAADDISYAIVDIEDGVELGILALDDVVDLLRPLIPRDSKFWSIAKSRERARREALRGDAIGTLTQEAARAFIQHEKSMRDGMFLRAGDKKSRPYRELMEEVEHAAQFQMAKKLAQERVFRHEAKAAMEYASFRVLGALLDAFCLPLRDWVRKESFSRRSEQVLSLMGRAGKDIHTSLQTERADSHYSVMLKIVGYVSGMTDSFAANLYRSLTGVAP